ncbi:MAG: hypothetical protein GX900_06000 [Clostridiaceae bacterium]|nr:hypothetical protein [Clostridiaceae bacterium]
MKRKNVRRALLVLLALLLSLSLAACRGGEPPAPSEGKDPTPGTTTAPKPTDKPVEPPEKTKISYFSYWMAEIEPESHVELLIEEALGDIDIEVVKENHNDEERVNLLLQADSMPDCLWTGKNPRFMYYEHELVRTIPRDLVEKYAPSFIKMYEADPVLWGLGLLKGSKDEFVALPGSSETYLKLYLECDLYRYDWIKEAGIDVGVDVTKMSDNMYITAGGISTDKWKEILTAYVAQDKIGAVSIQPKIMAGVFGAKYGESMEEDGKTIMYYTSKGYKEFLKYMADAYASGLLDKEILTQKRNEAWDKINSEKAGYFVSSTNSINGWALDRPPLALMKSNPQVEFLMTPGLADAQGNYGYPGFVSSQWGYFYVNADVQDEDKLIKILRMQEYANFGETIASHWYGEEGVDWEYNENGFPVTIGDRLAAGVKGTQCFCLFTQVEDVWKWITYEPLFEKGASFYVESEGGLWNKYLQNPGRIDPLQETNLQEVRRQYNEGLNSVVNTYYQDSILGIHDIDATWDQYLAELDESGYQELLAELSKAPTYEELIARFK